MGLFIPGMRCVLSGKVISSCDEAVVFPPFVSNEVDELFVFSDAVIHAEVFKQHPLASKAQERFEEFRQKMAPNNRNCFICAQLVNNPDDYFGIGYLTADRQNELFLYNYAHFHMSCIRSWVELNVMVLKLQQLNFTDEWQGHLSPVIDNLASFKK